MKILNELQLTKRNVRERINLPNIVLGESLRIKPAWVLIKSLIVMKSVNRNHYLNTFWYHKIAFRDGEIFRALAKLHVDHWELSQSLVEHHVEVFHLHDAIVCDRTIVLRQDFRNFMT